MLQKFINSSFLAKLYLVRYRKPESRKKIVNRAFVQWSVARFCGSIHYAARRTNTDQRKLSKGLSKVINPNKSKRGFDLNLYKAVISFYNRYTFLPHSLENVTPKNSNKENLVFKREYETSIWAIFIKSLHLSILTCCVYSHLLLEWGQKSFSLQTLQIEEPACAHNVKITLWSWKCLGNTQAFQQTQKHLSYTVIRKSCQLLTI